jgi:hypothetical protein
VPGLAESRLQQSQRMPSDKWDSALDLKGPKHKRTKQEETETEKIHKHVKDM